jgi:pimeloyl-ACP methyl ester carboxylesterase
VEEDGWMSERIAVSRPGCELIGERWAGPGPVVVLLHEGVTDRRGWAEVARLLSGTATVVAYDRRAFGESAPSSEPFTHVEDLIAVLDEVAGDKAELNRLETWIWLDGPGEPEGRVSGPARELALDMNEIVLRNDVPEDAGASGVDAWSRLSEVTMPVTVVCGDLDASFLVSGSRELAERLPQGRHRVLPGTAHTPFLEQPAVVAQLIADATKDS